MLLYHITPDSLNTFSLKYEKNFKTKGIFATKKPSIIHDWMEFTFRKNGSGHYNAINLYKLRCHKNTFDRIIDFNKEFESNGDWKKGEQYFIPEWALKEIEIVNKEEISYSQMLDMIHH